MPEAFDPYHRWLGIHTKDQPPHHYRLLGIDPFENDPEVIRDAAERQMTHVRKYQLSQHSALSQKILNELAAAKACLSDPPKKAEYDSALKLKLNNPPLPSAPLRDDRQVPPASGKDVEKISDFVKQPDSSTHISAAAIYFASGAILILAIIILTALFLRGNRNEPATAGQNKEIAQTDTPGAVKTPETKENESQPPSTSAKAQDVKSPEPPAPDRKPEALNPPKDIEPPKKADSSVPDANTSPPKRISPPAKQQVIPTDTPDTIIESVGWKNFRIGATKEELINAFGKPDIDDKWLRWGKFRITCLIDDKQKVIEIFFHNGFPDKTLKGIGIDSSLEKAIASYGKPNMTVTHDTGVTMHRWYSKGLGISFRNDRAIQIAVFASRSIPKPTNVVNRITLNLPTGKAFDSRIFDVDLNSARNALKDKAEKLQNNKDFIGNPVLLLNSPNDVSRAWAEYDKGKLDGAYLAFYKNDTPMIYANYTDGSRNGVLKKWNETGERVYWCQYVKNFRNGFCCYFKDDILRIILEINRNKVTAVHLCSNNELEKSFDSEEQALADDQAKGFITELDDIESELTKTEAAYKKQVINEDKRVRQQKAAELSVQGRESIQDRMNQRSDQRQNEINSLRQKGGGM